MIPHWIVTKILGAGPSRLSGRAGVKIKDGSFEYLLNVSKPAGIPFNSQG